MRIFLRVGLFLSLLLVATQAGAAISFNNSFRSKRNPERAVRKTTSLIILHTTEAPSKSALPKLSERGECHYCIDEAGKVFRIIDHRREAYHAGRSMWRGRPNVDSYSVGIEVCGYHNKPLAAVQIKALGELIGELKHIYKIADHNVIAHAHVAYGTPNKWHKRSHRGRKRCGMQFALPAMRTLLNLKARPTVDPDVRSGRLIVADVQLARILYGNSPTLTRQVTQGAQVAAVKNNTDNVIAKGQSAWDIARDAYSDRTTLYEFPDGTKKFGNQIADFKMIPVGTKITVSADISENIPERFQTIGENGTAKDIAGEEALSASTLYINRNGTYQRGNQMNSLQLEDLPYGTRVLVGYAVGGPITAKLLASQICGNRWRSPDSYFLINKTLIAGNTVDDKKIPVGALIFYKN